MIRLRSLLALVIVAAGAASPALGQTKARRPEPWFLTVSHRVDLNRQVAGINSREDARASRMGPRFVTNITSGVLVDAEGHVVTRLVNLDPTASPLELSVTTTSGKILKAGFVGLDGPTGLAILLVPELRGLKPIPSGETSGFAEGEAVTILTPVYKLRQLPAPIERTAMPPALSEMQATVALASPHPALARAGVVCVVASKAFAQSQDLSLLESRDGRTVGLVKFASVGQGQVIGVPFLRDVVARRVVAAGGNVAAGKLGAEGTSSAEGVRVETIAPGGPAAAAGLQRDDVIVGFEDFDVRNTIDLMNAVGSTPAETRVQLKVRRGGETLTLPLVLGAQPFVPGRPIFTQDTVKRQAELMQIYLAQLQRQLERAKTPAEREQVQAQIDRALGRTPATPAQRAAASGNVDLHGLGLSGITLTAQMAARRGVSGGYLVAEVAPGSVADRAGLQADDAIVGVDGAAIADDAALRAALRAAVSGGAAAVELSVTREGAPVKLTLSVESLRQ